MTEENNNYRENLYEEVEDLNTEELSAQEKKDRKRTATILSGSLVVISFVFVFFLVRLQFHTPKNNSILPANSSKESVEPIRGTIYDTNGYPLALATPSYDIVIDCKANKNDWIGKKTIENILNDPKVTNKERAIAIRKANEEFWENELKTVAVKLDSILKKDPTCKLRYEGNGNDLYEKIIDKRMNGKSNNITVATNVTHSSYRQIASLNILSYTKYINPITGKKVPIAGCLCSKDNENYRIARNYPYEPLAKKIIGENNNANRTYNCTGIEGRYDAVLRGVPGTVFVTKTDGRKEIVDVDSLNVEPQNGYDIHTTIDIRIQEIAHRALEKRISELNQSKPCSSGVVIVMESQTGAIRAMVNLGLDEKDGRWKENQGENLAVRNPRSPGSVFKSVLMMQLLEDKKITLDSKIPTFNGNYDAEGFNRQKNKKYFDKELTHKYLRDHKIGNNVDSIKVRDAFAISSNNAFRWLAVTHYGKDAAPYINRIYQLKFREALPFDIEQPATPRFPQGSMEKGPTLPTLAIGTNIDVTPLHILTFYNAIALEGKMIQPYLIDHFSKDGEIMKDTDFGNTGPRVLNSAICSKETALTLKEALREVVTNDNGTANSLRKLPEAVAGKTGTARQTNNGSYEEDGTGKRIYQATFIGFWPYDNPRYTMIVVMNSKPVDDAHTLYGAAGIPVFKEIYNQMYGMGL